MLNKACRVRSGYRSPVALRTTSSTSSTQTLNHIIEASATSHEAPIHHRLHPLTSSSRRRLLLATLPPALLLAQEHLSSVCPPPAAAHAASAARSLPPGEWSTPGLNAPEDPSRPKFFKVSVGRCCVGTEHGMDGTLGTTVRDTPRG